MTSVVKGLFSAIGGLLHSPKVPTPIPQVTRDDAAAQQSATDELMRRKGSAADILTGTQGAEAAANQVGKLVIGN